MLPVPTCSAATVAMRSMATRSMAAQSMAMRPPLPARSAAQSAGARLLPVQSVPLQKQRRCPCHQQLEQV